MPGIEHAPGDVETAIRLKGAWSLVPACGATLALAWLVIRLAHSCGFFVLALAFAVGASVWLRGKYVDRIHHLAATGPMSSTVNREILKESVEAEILRSKRTGKPFAVVLLNLGGLEDINDSVGPRVHNGAFNRVGDILRRNLREIDFGARYEADAFAVVLPMTDERGARKTAQRLCLHISQTGEYPPICASAGVALYPRDADSCMGLFAAADHARYENNGAKVFNPIEQLNILGRAKIDPSIAGE